MSRTARRTTPARPAPARPRPTLHAASTPDGPALRWAAMGLIVAFALAALAVALGPHRVGDVFTETDFYGSYGPGARALQHGHLDPSRYGVVGPMFELLLALTGWLVRDLFLAAELIAVASMTVVLACWWSLLARRVGSAIALLTVAFLASNAQFFRYAWAATTDAPALALQAAALWALLAPREPHGEGSPWRVRTAGLLAALAFLTRYSSVALLPAGLAAVAFGWTGTPRGARLRRALDYAGAFALPVVPWLAWSAAHGASLQGQLHHNLAYEVFGRPHGVVWDEYARDLQPQFPTLWSVLARDPAAVASRLAFNVVDHVRLDARLLAGTPLAIAAAAGLWLAWRDGLLARLAPLLLALALLFLTLVPAFHSERYSLAVLPLWALLAAVALASPRFALPLGRVWAKLLLVPLLLLPALAATRSLTARTLDQLPVEVLGAAAQVRPWLRPGDKVLARKPHFGWYAGLETAPLPLTDSLTVWADAARRERARWLYFSWPEAQFRPRFDWLLDTTSAAPGLTVRAATSHWPAVVYEIGDGFGEAPAWAGNDTLVAEHRARARVLYDLRARDARVFLAVRAMESGNPAAAQGYLDQLLALDPGDAEALLMAGDNRVALGDPGGALGYYERLERVRPGTAEAQVGRGWVAALRGDEAGAARAWAPVVRVTTDARTLRRMAVAFARTGDTARVQEVRMQLQAIGVLP